MTGSRRETFARQHQKAVVWKLVVNSYPCRVCSAPAGRACKTERGRATEPHAERARAAAIRGWAFADAPARCYRCHRPLPGEDPTPGRCERCRKREDGPLPTHATRDHPGPDGSYDAPLFGDE